MKISEHFVMQEFLPPEIYNKILRLKTEKARLNSFYQYVDIRIVALAESYRNYFKVPIIINNWHNGGTFTLRGYRPKSTKIGAAFSQHKIGRAFDCDVKGLSATEVRKIIRENESVFYEMGLRRVESGVTWLHSDIKETGEAYNGKILFFNP